MAATMASAVARPPANLFDASSFDTPPVKLWIGELDTTSVALAEAALGIEPDALYPPLPSAIFTEVGGM